MFCAHVHTTTKTINRLLIIITATSHIFGARGVHSVGLWNGWCVKGSRLK